MYGKCFVCKFPPACYGKQVLIEWPRPVRTFNTAVMYYHHFRLVHPDNEYNYVVSFFVLVSECEANFPTGCSSGGFIRRVQD